MAGLVACVAAGKLLREAFTDHVTLPWSVFFAILLATVDLGSLSHGVLVDCFWATVVVLKVRCRHLAYRCIVAAPDVDGCLQWLVLRCGS